MSEDKKRLFGGALDKFVHVLLKNEKKIYVALSIMLLIFLLSLVFDFINLKKVFAFAIFVLVGGAFKYIISRFKIFFEFTPILFFCVIIAKYMGIIWVIPYIFIADIFPMILGHHGPTAGSVPYWIWMFVFSILMIPLDITNIFIRILVPLLYFGSTLAIEQFVKGGLNGWRWTSAIANLVITFYFFVKLTPFFVGLIGG